jgi:hypothetical protein
MSQWSRGEEAHAAVALSTHLVNGGRTDIPDGRDSRAISQRAVVFVKDLLAVHGLDEGIADILTVPVLQRHQGVDI